MGELKNTIRCPGCGVSPGIKHLYGCDVERCRECGDQAIGCGCEAFTTDQRLPWTGEWPGDDACREFGFFQTDGKPDLNTMLRKTKWDPVLRKRVLL